MRRPHSAIECFIKDIPAPNYMSPERRKELFRWGRKTFPVIIEKSSSTDVDFSMSCLTLSTPCTLTTPAADEL